eukprot:3641957-Lingulodinium_polyedra.AAC.1
MVAIPEASKDAIKFLDARAWRVQRRLMCVVQDVISKKKEQVPAPCKEKKQRCPNKKERAAQQLEEARVAGHELKRRAGSWVCRQCMQVLARGPGAAAR